MKYSNLLNSKLRFILHGLLKHKLRSLKLLIQLFLTLEEAQHILIFLQFRRHRLQRFSCFFTDNVRLTAFIDMKFDRYIFQTIFLKQILNVINQLCLHAQCEPCDIRISGIHGKIAHRNLYCLFLVGNSLCTKFFALFLKLL